VGNAIKFTTKGGIKIIVRYNQAANWLEVDVKDTGIGI
jgi:signal transduction histidine kinase